MIIIKPIISILAVLIGMLIDVILSIITLGWYYDNVTVSRKIGWRLYCKITEKLYEQN